MKETSTPRINKIRKYLEKSMQFVEIRYLPRFEKVWIYFGDKEVLMIDDQSKLDDGVAFRTADGRVVEIQKRMSPNEFVIKVNGKYLPGTKHDPKNKVSSVYFLYMGLVVLGLFGTIFSFFSFNVIIIGVMFFYMLSVIIALVGLYKGNKYLFYYGFGIIVLDTLLVIIGYDYSSYGTIVVGLWILYRAYVIFESIRKMKYLHEYHNYRVGLKKYNFNGEVLDF